MARIFIIFAAISALVAVIMGAFAAHALKQQLAPELLSAVQTAVLYQMFHALALLAVALLIIVKPNFSGLTASGLAFILGSFLFSGSLYALALGAPRWFGPITPLGGLCFMVGWVLLAWAAWRAKA